MRPRCDNQPVKAVLWDMDGTIIDSEKLWDVAINELYARHGRVLAPEIRESTVGGSADGVIRIVFEDLGLDPDPTHMATSPTGCTTTSANSSALACPGVTGRGICWKRYRR